MTIGDAARKRGVKSVVHFTTNKGALGILVSNGIKSRECLNDDQKLEYIFQPNAADRTRDAAWLNYVNLSVSRINTQFFDVSAGSWHKHRDIWWCIFSFSPVVLEHPEVVFTTTNNIYTGVSQKKGKVGFEEMFSPSVVRWHGNIAQRYSGQPAWLTTCHQAEVLYKGEISTEFLETIYVQNEDAGDELAAQIRAVGHRAVEVRVDPTKFVKIK
jgi:hypothetical protein